MKSTLRLFRDSGSKRAHGSGGPASAIPAERRHLPRCLFHCAASVAALFMMGCISLYLGEPMGAVDDDTDPVGDDDTGDVTDAPSDDDSDPVGDDDTGDVTDAPVDADGDGWTIDSDCDDDDAATYPGATETCGDQTDNDCDGEVDQGCDDTVCGAEDLVGSLAVTDSTGTPTLVFTKNEDPTFESRLSNTCVDPTILFSDDSCYGTIAVLNKAGVEVNAFPAICDAVETSWQIDPGESLTYRWIWNRSDSSGQPLPESGIYTVVASWLTGESVQSTIWLVEEGSEPDEKGSARKVVDQWRP